MANQTKTKKSLLDKRYSYEKASEEIFSTLDVEGTSDHKLTTEQLKFLLHWANVEVNYSAGMKELAESENTEAVFKTLPKEIQQSDGESIKNNIDWGQVENITNIKTDYNVYVSTDMQKGGRVYLLTPKSVGVEYAQLILRVLSGGATAEDYKNIAGEDAKDDDYNYEITQMWLDDVMKEENVVYIDQYDRQGYPFDFLGYKMYKDSENNVYIV